MEYLIPLVLVAVVAVIVVAIYLGLRKATSKKVKEVSESRRRAQVQQAAARAAADANIHNSGNLTQRITPTAAAQASARLDEETHRQVYQFLAVGKTGQAAEVYRQATGVSVVDAMLDVQAMSVYPQEWVSMDDVDLLTGKQHGGGDEALEKVDEILSDRTSSEVDTRFSTSRADEDELAITEEELNELLIPEEWTQDLQADTKDGFDEVKFRVEVLRPDGIARLSSDELPPWLRDQLGAMMRDGRYEAAAKELSEHSMLTEQEAHDLVKTVANDILKDQEKKRAEQQRQRSEQNQAPQADADQGGDDTPPTSPAENSDQNPDNK